MEEKYYVMKTPDWWSYSISTYCSEDDAYRYLMYVMVDRGQPDFYVDEIGSSLMEWGQYLLRDLISGVDNIEQELANKYKDLLDDEYDKAYSKAIYDFFQENICDEDGIPHSIVPSSRNKFCNKLYSLIKQISALGDYQVVKHNWVDHRQLSKLEGQAVALLGEVLYREPFEYIEGTTKDNCFYRCLYPKSKEKIKDKWLPYIENWGQEYLVTSEPTNKYEWDVPVEDWEDVFGDYDPLCFYLFSAPASEKDIIIAAHAKLKEEGISCSRNDIEML